MKSLFFKKTTLALNVLVIFLLFIFLFSVNIGKAATWLCDDNAGVTNTIVDLCPVPTGPVSCTSFDTVSDAVCPTGWECSTPACLAECNFNLGVNCPVPPGTPPGPGCTTNAPTVCGCTCPGGPVPGPGCTGSTAGCDYDEGENMFNCPADCLPAGIPNKLIPDVIDSIISWLLTFAVAISVLVLVYGGTCYVFSSGDAQKAENAKKIVKYALLGIFVAGISFAIIKILDTIFH